MTFGSVTFLRCAFAYFAYAGPSNWNSLPAHFRDSSLSIVNFQPPP